MSLGYMILCVPLIIQITDYFHLEEIHQQGKKWLHRFLICGPLMIYSFLWHRNGRLPSRSQDRKAPSYRTGLVSKRFTNSSSLFLMTRCWCRIRDSPTWMWATSTSSSSSALASSSSSSKAEYMSQTALLSSTELRGENLLNLAQKEKRTSDHFQV